MCGNIKINNALDRYYPFGMVTPGRSFAAGDGYRFGFNGKEGDDNISGNGNLLDFGFRIYNSRLGTWFSMDPEETNNVDMSPYAFSMNSPIRYKDPDGRDPIEGGMELNVHVGFFAYAFIGTDMPGPGDKVKLYDLKMYRKFDAWTLFILIPDIILPDVPKNMQDVLQDFAKDLGTAELASHVDNLITATFSRSYSLDNFEYTTPVDPNNINQKPEKFIHRIVSDQGAGFESMVTYKEEYNLLWSKDDKGKDIVSANIKSATIYREPYLNPKFGIEGEKYKNFKYLQDVTTIEYNEDGTSTRFDYTIGVSPRPENTKICSVCE